MSSRPPAPAAPTPDGPLGNLLAGPVDAETRGQLDAASGGDPALLRTLVQTGLRLGDLAYDGECWRWDPPSRVNLLADLIEARSGGLPADEHGSVPRLTTREQQVLALLSAGLTAASIARRLYLSPRTVAKYQQRTYRKLGTCDRLTAVLRAQRLGLLEPPAP